MKIISWYSHRYPSTADLEALACDLGVMVMDSPLDTVSFTPPLFEGGIPVIGVPCCCKGLERIWLLAHELGHLVQHPGPGGATRYGKDERAADLWASRALIPMERVRRYGSASSDAFIAALSRHYEKIPFWDCEVRQLAGRIAQIRLWAMSSESAVGLSEASSWG